MGLTRINSYLTFNGNCREAMMFYKNCLGGELVLQTIGDSPLADKLPQQMKESILHSSLAKDGLLLLASDMVGDRGLIKGTQVSLLLHCGSEEEIRIYYDRLAEGGQATHPLQTSFWGTLFGDLTDKFGNQWLLQYEYKSGVKILCHDKKKQSSRRYNS